MAAGMTCGNIKGSQAPRRPKFSPAFSKDHVFGTGMQVGTVQVDPVVLPVTDRADFILGSRIEREVVAAGALVP